MPLKAADPKIPTTTGPAPLDKNELTGVLAAQPCRAADLTTSSSWHEWFGTKRLTIVLEAVGNTRCLLRGQPGVTALTSGASPIAALHENHDLIARGVLVQPGHPVGLDLSWSSWCSAPTTNPTLRMSLPNSGGDIEVDGFGASPACGQAITSAGPRGMNPNGIFVHDFGVFRQSFFFVRTAYNFVVPTMSGPGLLFPVDERGKVHVEVTLVADRDTVLDPCPDYTIEAGLDEDDTGTSGRTAKTYALNCAQVPYRDERGRPYLPAMEPVAFEMVGTVQPHLRGKRVGVNWRLDVADHRETNGPSLDNFQN
jgi:hypothetical protein